MSDSAIVKKVIHMTMLAGRIMLESSAETYRVEDTIVRLCSTIKCVDYVDVFVIPTGIFLTIGYGDNAMTYIKRTKPRGIDLDKITLVNDFSRSFVNSDMSLDEAMDVLHKINDTSSYSKLKVSIFGGLTGGFSALLYGGVFSDFACAFIITAIVVFIKNVLLKKISLIGFMKDFIVCVVGTMLAIMCVELNFASTVDMIIIGFIMPLVPGFIITNAARDTISGDFLAGLSRASEAAISALSIASGVGIVLNLFSYLL